MNKIYHAICGTSALFLVGCAATSTALEHGSLKTDTKLSETVFLDPVASSQKTIYVAIKNTSQETVSIDRPLKSELEAHGYRVVSSPSAAHYMIQANIKTVGKMSQSASKAALGGGFGSALMGAGAGAAIGSFSSNSNAMLAGGLAGGAIGLVADSLVKDVNYTMITDVQISERVGKGKVKEQFNAALANGSSSGTTQSMSQSSDYKRYRVRIVSNADKVNLAFAQARPVLEQELAKTLAGIF